MRPAASDEKPLRVISAKHRWLEKQAERQRDVEMLERGEIDAEELKRRNGAVAEALRGARIVFDRPDSLA